MPIGLSLRHANRLAPSGPEALTSVAPPARRQRRRMGCFASHARQSSGVRSLKSTNESCGTCHTALPVFILARRAVCKSFASQMFSVAIKQVFRTFHLRFTHRSFVKTNGHWWCSSGVSRPNDDRYGAISVNLSESTTQSRELGRRIPQWASLSRERLNPCLRQYDSLNWLGILYCHYATNRAQNVVHPRIPICAKL